MLKIVEAVNKNSVRLPVKPGVKITPGHIVKTTMFGNQLVIDVCDGDSPFGISGNRCIGGTFVDYKRIVRVYLQRMIVNITKFDRNSNMGIGDSVYCNEVGVLTSNKPFLDSIVLGKVILPASDNRKDIQILWL